MTWPTTLHIGRPCHMMHSQALGGPLPPSVRGGGGGGSGGGATWSGAGWKRPHNGLKPLGGACQVTQSWGTF